MFFKIFKYLVHDLSLYTLFKKMLQIKLFQFTSNATPSYNKKKKRKNITNTPETFEETKINKK